MTSQNVGGTSVLFPDMNLLDVIFDDDHRDKPASNWSLTKIGSLQAKIENIRARYQSRRFRNVEIELPLHRLISIANEAFGYDGWSSELKDFVITDYTVGNDNSGTHSLRVKSTVRITLKDGTYHEASGKGQADNLPTKSMAYMKAKKSSVTDATKNAIYGFKDIVLDHEQKLRMGFYQESVNIFN